MPIVSLSFLFSFLKAGTISAISNSSLKVPVDMELFIQFVIGSAISSFAILIIFAGRFPLELYDLINANKFKFKLKGIFLSELLSSFGY